MEEVELNRIVRVSSTLLTELTELNRIVRVSSTLLAELTDFETKWLDIVIKIIQIYKKS